MTSRILPPRIPPVDPRTGGMAREWYLYFLSLQDGVAALDADPFGVGPLLPDASLSDRVAELERLVDDLRKGTVVL